uniref:histone H2A-like n=1 Tax=Centroberyx gerrardi TaxID=166262 RepID=UPI003AABB42B
MSGSGKKAAPKTKMSMTKSSRAGMSFPVGRIHTLLRKGSYAQRVGTGASIYRAAVLGYLCAELLELAGTACHDNKRRRITPRHILLAVRNDEEPNKLLAGVTISEGGVLPNIQASLLPMRTQDVKGRQHRQRHSPGRCTVQEDSAVRPEHRCTRDRRLLRE